MISVEQSIFEFTKQNPQKIALKSGKTTVSYGELVNRCLAAKCFFEAMPNYKKGACVILAAGKQVEFAYAYFGAHLAGLKVAPIDPETNPTRFDFIVQILNPCVVNGFDKIQEPWVNKSLK